MRIAIGIVALVLLAAAAVFWFQDNTTAVGISARLGLIMAAVWLAYPVVTEVGPRSWIFTGVAVVVIVLRPRAAIVVLPALALALRRRDASVAR